ncbi:MAG: hypothetical protein B6D68_03625, partial [spirochete symbiont of Stewartia floridana]
KLKPVLGIPPRIYVPVIWLLIGMTLVFLLLILPGIRRNGTWLTVYSDPPDASIIADGQRLGHSCKPVFVPKGVQEIRLRRPGFSDKVLRTDIGGRILASRIFPRRDEMTVTLDAEPSHPPIHEGIKEFAAWSAARPDRERYAIPPILTRLARDLTAAHSPLIEANAMAKAILPMARDARHLADINRALYLLSFPESAVNPLNLAAYLGKAANFLDEYSNLSGLLAIAGEDAPDEISPRSSAGLETAEYTGSGEALRQLYERIRNEGEFPRTAYSGIAFVTIPALNAVIGDVEIVDLGNYRPRFGALPVKVVLGSYMISLQEISNDQFAAFIAENPYWSVKNGPALIERGLADDGYLRKWKDDVPTKGEGFLPVTDVSWHAANAYTEWLSMKVFPAGNGQVRLPREDEWEVAARLNNDALSEGENRDVLLASKYSVRGEIGLAGMAGNVREWCYNPFRYNENTFRVPSGRPSYLEIDSELASEDRTVRGGAYIDKDLPYPAAARGSLKANQTSPVLGFRIVVIR